ncbi:MAG TPA: tetratricopeptide repeat protein [Candidatus Wallbacteria bacterium]|nr:MAG: flagellar assembly protein H [bacterium ADurb.Bin243]HOD41053.1 tetratricopeptide repeat protein [Candidatus Wallbacteria bacterium]HPG57543.1 tetratricopeptide repeat protein [Candidatus Wallbacteria bacterium]
MKKVLAIGLALFAAAGFSMTSASALEMPANSTETASKHYDPSHNGHSHQCAKCGANYNQPGDMGQYSSGTYTCPRCGFTNPQPNNPGGYPNNPPYQPPYQPPFQPGTNGLPTYTNPYNDPSYDYGYRDGYNQGYRNSYAESYQEGLRQGERDGYNNGLKEGENKFNAKYFNYVYTQEKLADLIKKIKFPGRGITENANLAGAETKNGRNGAYYPNGYNDGIFRGRTDGRNDGLRDGSKKTYPEAYSRGYAEGFRIADVKAHGDVRKYTFEEQFGFGCAALNTGDYWTALFRFNLILVEEPANGPFRNKAFWYAGYTKMKQKEHDAALAIFIIFNLNFPETLKEETTLNIASLLLEVKTGGFIGIGSTKYYDKAKNMLDWWIASFPNSQRLPEAYFTLGNCYEKLKDTNNAVLTYKKVADLYPNTSIAEDAKKRIKAISSWWPWD